jgi:hypothetical protein
MESSRALGTDGASWWRSPGPRRVVILRPVRSFRARPRRSALEGWSSKMARYSAAFVGMRIPGASSCTPASSCRAAAYWPPAGTPGRTRLTGLTLMGGSLV